MRTLNLRNIFSAPQRYVTFSRPLTPGRLNFGARPRMPLEFCGRPGLQWLQSTARSTNKDQALCGHKLRQITSRHGWSTPAKFRFPTPGRGRGDHNAPRLWTSPVTTFCNAKGAPKRNRRHNAQVRLLDADLIKSALHPVPEPRPFERRKEHSNISALGRFYIALIRVYLVVTEVQICSISLYAIRCCLPEFGMAWIMR